jgi:hypothetical protein
MRRYLPLAIMLLITAVFVVALDNFLGDVIIQPVLYVIWFAGLVLSSLHQSVFWGVLLFVALVLALRSLGGTQPRTSAIPEKRYPTQGHVRRWMLLLERAETQRFTRWNLAQSLRKLAQETLGPDDRDRQAKSRAPFDQNLPADIANYFNAKLPPAQSLSLRQRLQRKSSQPSHPLDLNPEVVIDFLEKETGRLAGD